MPDDLRMKILLVNKFLYPKGGDAAAVRNTGGLLEASGHEVIYWGMKHPSNPPYAHEKYFVDNVDYDNPGNLLRRIGMAVNILYSFEARAKIGQLLEADRPDIAHLNNFAHQISPSILDALKRYAVPAVMTMHDYKLACPSYSMLAHGRPCQRCSGGAYYRCFLNGCVKGSRAKSLINTLEMYLHHDMLKIYDNVGIFIAPSVFMKKKLEEMGFRKRIEYLPNFISARDYTPRYDCKDRSIVYLGRLSGEKGLFTLVEAMKKVPGVSLKVIGEGPLRECLEARARDDGLPSVKFLGYMRGDALKDEMAASMFMVLPSECYENNPISVLEAFASGKPVIGARTGGIPELVKDGETGLTFEPGDPADLAAKIDHLAGRPEAAAAMGRNARSLVERDFCPEVHYKRLMQIYAQAMEPGR
jgi:glycosyltransferase involved in cell wall biosynthesis